MGFYSSLEFVDLSNYWRSGTWDLVDVPARIINITYEGLTYSYIIYAIKLRRKTLFYTVNLIVPCVMLSLLSIFVFYLPSDAGEKVTLAISIVVALVVFFILVSKILPPNSSTIPLISRYLMFTFISDVFAVFMAVLVVNWNYRSPSTHVMTWWVRVMFLKILPRLLLMNPLQHDEELIDGAPFQEELPERASLDLISSISTDSPDRHLYANLRSQHLSTSSSYSLDDENAVTFANSDIKIRQLKSSPYRIGVKKRREADTCQLMMSNAVNCLNVGLKAVDYISDHFDAKYKNKLVRMSTYLFQ